MLAENNTILASATESLYKYNSDWLVRERCRAREDYENHERYVQQELERLNASLAEKDHTIKEQSNTIQEKDSIIQEKDALIAQLQAQLKAQNKS